MVDYTFEILIGRAILAFGQLDQSIYSHLSYLGWQRTKRLLRDQPGAPRVPHVAEEPRLNHRLKMLRSLIAETTNDDRLLRKFDTQKTQFKELERMRAHLAHGSIAQENGKIVVHDQREWRELGLQDQKLHDRIRHLDPRTQRKTLWAERERLKQRHTRISYDETQLEELITSLESVKAGFEAVINEAWEIAEQRYNQSKSGR